MDFVSSIVQYQSSTAGRDSICRLLQYTAKLISHLLTKENSQNDLIKRLKQCESVLSTSRKTFRIGKSVDMIEGAMKARAIDDPVLKALIIASRLCRAVYFYYDMLAWAVKASILTGDEKKMTLKSAPFWFWAVLASLLRDIYELILEYNSKLNKNKNFLQSLKNRPELLCDTLKNFADLHVVLQFWGEVDISQGTVGFCGMISSFIGIFQILRPELKLSPI
ncbi:peroxisomal membrane protein 11A-like [Hydractinia symbiolongicarpus]|uniref:peroxisomal membrane protein 11A-like n=1 Tax=Hydractinia symbiolongicarpus TaxID=13093 RepID=UPI00254F11D4|nr:peroxisomal membrane protein 11A-like [Hydractinia symbiolongicarpus]